VQPESNENILTRTNYAGFEFCSSIKKDNIFGFQFHPEKSGKEGLMIYDNFLKI
jgi:glutamine amidotransferase